jgi:hypothetical protein
VRKAILGTEAEVDTGACPAVGTPLGTGAPDSTIAAVLGPVESGTGVRAMCRLVGSPSESAPKEAANTRVSSFGTAPPEVRESAPGIICSCNTGNTLTNPGSGLVSEALRTVIQVVPGRMKALEGVDVQVYI